jgi:hypothetical protein
VHLNQPYQLCLVCLIRSPILRLKKRKSASKRKLPLLNLEAEVEAEAVVVLTYHDLTIKASSLNYDIFPSKTLAVACVGNCLKSQSETHFATGQVVAFAKKLSGCN